MRVSDVHWDNSVLKFHLDGIRKETVPKENGVSPQKKWGGDMRIGFVGAGKVGFSLGKYFTEHNLCVSGYYSQNSLSAKEAAEFTGTKYYETLKEITEESDTLFLTVNDGAISGVYSEIARLEISGKIICHCSGAMSSEVFDGIRERGAFGYSVHPIYAFNHKLESYQGLSQVYFTIEGAYEHLEEILNLFRQMGNKAEILSKEGKARYHMAAVFASNLVEGLYDCASEILESCGLSQEFSQKALLPLFLGNAEAIGAYGVERALTGPVERGDLQTIEKHLNASGGDERKIYTLLSQKLVEISQKKYPNRDYKKIKEVLIKQ